MGGATISGAAMPCCSGTGCLQERQVRRMLAQLVVLATSDQLGVPGHRLNWGRQWCMCTCALQIGTCHSAQATAAHTRSSAPPQSPRPLHFDIRTENLVSSLNENNMRNAPSH
jgi:hypothetical protein